MLCNNSCPVSYTHLDVYKRQLFNTVGNLCVLLCMMGIDQAFIRYYYEENETGRVKLSKIFMVFCVLNTLAISVVFFVLKTQIAKSLFGIDSYVPVSYTHLAALDIWRRSRRSLWSDPPAVPRLSGSGGCRNGSGEI